MSRLLLTIFFAFFVLSGCERSGEPDAQLPGKILVLMYHRITPGVPADEYERSVTSFEGDLIFYKENNINVLSLNDLQNIVTTGKMPPGNSVILTFDDGDQSWYNYVRPLLIKYKIKATFFLWTAMMDQNSFISWDQVSEMSRYTLASGEKPFVFGSHTYSHAFLLQEKADFPTLEQYESFLDYELGVSKSVIEEHVPDAVTALSLPYGDGEDDPDILAAVVRNGYKFVRTSRWGNIPDASSLDLLNIPSLPVLDTTSVRFIKYQLEK